MAVGLGTLIPTGGFGEPLCGPGELVAYGEELAFAVALAGVGVGVGPGDSDGSLGTGEMAERVAGWGAEDDAAEAWAAAEEAASDASAAADAAEVAGPDPGVAELAAAELPGAGFTSAGFVEVLHAASAERAAIVMTTWMRRAVLVRRAIPHAATLGARRSK
ncbi:MAG TPA: hypothetical protein VIJ96_02280 [Acidothermaceae bacterium]